LLAKKVAAMKVRDNLGQLLDEVYYRGDEVVIERAGKAMAILVPVGRYEQYQRDRKERFKILDQIKAKSRKIPAKRLVAAIGDAVRPCRARR
jgi:antitoxin (DNA-binding transcriptional repressor) of toxin-antitoxin stability system